MGNLLFSPQGRILKRRFWQGIVVLTVATVLFQAFQVRLGPALGLGGQFIFMIAGLALLYMEICVYAKRFHDAGMTGWMILLVWVGGFIVGYVLNMILQPIFLDADAFAIQEEVAERLAQGELMVAVEGMQKLADGFKGPADFAVVPKGKKAFIVVVPDLVKSELRFIEVLK